MGFKAYDVISFEKYIKNLKVSRRIKLLQLHHTYSPSYRQFTGSNHEKLQQSMKNHHVNTNGWADIGQHFTIFPDGIIMTGRSIESNPAGIYGANSGAICIECLGNFDKGGDTMTDAQKEAIIATVKILLDKFSLSASSDVTYHSWWSANGKKLGTYIEGKSVKTCPGTSFFGGNTKEAYRENLMPLIEKYTTTPQIEKVESINDIVWELSNAGIIADSPLWMQKCESDKNIYWLCYKMANKLRGTS